MVLQLESYEEMKSPLPVFINVDQVEKELLSPDTAGQREKSAGHQTSDNIYIGSMELNKNGGSEISSGEK